MLKCLFVCCRILAYPAMFMFYSIFSTIWGKDLRGFKNLAGLPLIRRKKQMKKFFSGMITNTGVVGEVIEFLWARKLWWLIPMVSVLLLFGLLLIFASSSGVAPFIYTLF